MTSRRLLLALGLAIAAAQAVPCDDSAGDPSRIAVAGGSITEILYALGEQHRIVAVDTTSTYPPEAGRHPSVGYVRNLSAEGLLSMSPTLILGEHDMGPDTVLQQIAGADVDVIRLAEVFAAQGIARKVICVGRAIGREAKAREFVDTHLRPTMARLHSLSGRGTGPRVAVLLSVGAGAPTAAGANTSGNGLLEMAGADNVFTTFSGWKPISVEYMSIAAPELVVVPERAVKAAGGIEALLANPLIRMTPAGRSGSIVVMDGMAMLGFGPRTLSSALQLAERMQQQ